MGDLSEWLRGFRDLHERARKRSLTPEESTRYLLMRDELARAMLAAQKISLKPGQVPRRALRVARAIQLDIDVNAIRERSLTLDLSSGGFSTTLARVPAVGDLVDVRLRLPGGEPLACRARVTDIKPLGGSTRVAAQFVDVPAADLEKLEFFILDNVISMISA